MKKFKAFVCGSMMVCAALFILGCRKEITDVKELQAIASLQLTGNTECKAAVFGAYTSSTFSPNNRWVTLAQKWYANGKVKYLKAKSTRFTSTFFFDPFLELMYDLEWGQVIYEGNQVYLRDLVNDRTLMRVTLDDHGRPAASYYYNQQAGALTYWYDTTYYYYKGDRLDDMISLFHTNEYNSYYPVHSWRRYRFTYDPWGNVITAGDGDGLNFNIEYDYTKPVHGIILNYQLTSSLSLLENMELIKLPMHHAVTKIGYGTPSTTTEYKDYEIVDGLVRSYVYWLPNSLSQDKTTLYNGWNCETNMTNGNPIANLRQFQDMYPKN